MSRRRHADNLSTGAPRPECAQVCTDLLAFLDGDLDGAAHRAMQAHLDSCPGCRREWEWQRQAEHALLTAQSHVPPAGDLRTGFYARLADQDLNRRPSLTAVLRRALPTLAVPAMPLLLMIVLYPLARYPQYAAERAAREQDEWTSAPFRSAPIQVPDTAIAARQSATENRNTSRTGLKEYAFNGHVTTSSRSVAVIGSGVGNRRHLHVAAHHDEAVPVVRLAEIAVPQPPKRPLPPIVLSNVKPVDLLVSNQADADAHTDFDSAGTTAHFGRYRRELAKNMTPTGTTRAALLSEEVNVHIVDDQNVEVSSLHVTPVNAATAETDVIHVEAGLDDGESAKHGEAPEAQR
jgi:anti-sigma factor RsiW